MDGWFNESRQNPQLYVADYIKLFVDTVRTAVAEVDSDFPFVDSSPSNGLLSTNPYVKRYITLGRLLLYQGLPKVFSFLIKVSADGLQCISLLPLCNALP